MEGAAEGPVKVDTPSGSEGGSFFPSMNVTMNSLLANVLAQEDFHERCK